VKEPRGLLSAIGWPRRLVVGPAPTPRPLEDLADNKPLEERYEGDLVTGLSLISLLNKPPPHA